MHPKWVRSRVAASAGVLVGGMWVSSLALFSHSDRAGGSFTTGTVEISAGGGGTILTVTDMAPGDVTYAPLTVSNTGTLEHKYTMGSTASNDDGLGLAAALVVDVFQAATCDDAGNGARTATLASGTLDTVAISSARTLGAGASEVLCFRVELPLTATSPEGAATAATFSFNAEQTRNNP